MLNGADRILAVDVLIGAGDDGLNPPTASAVRAAVASPDDGRDRGPTPAAINGVSDLILALWGDAGRHARSAIGAGELPFGMPVEVEAVVALA